MNGLNIASASLEIGHIDHPGTPVQLLTGLIIKLTHILTGQGTLNDSVIGSPELYIKVCSVVTIATFLLIMYYIPLYVYKNSGNILQSFIFQLVPFSSYSSIHHMSILKPESFTVILLFAFYGYIWVKCIKEVNEKNNYTSTKEFIIASSLFCAFLITTKIINIPFIIIPLFLINKWYKKISFFFLTCLFAGLITFPIWDNYEHIYNWVCKLSTHSGMYGSGQDNFVNWRAFRENLTLIFSIESFFTIGLVLCFFFMIFFLLKRPHNKVLLKLMLSLFIVIFLQVSLASKHFAYHYILGAQVSIIPFIICVTTFTNNFFTSFKKYIGILLISAVLCFLIFKQYKYATIFKKGNKVFETTEFIKKYSKTPTILTSSYESTPYVESALKFGLSYSGPNRTQRAFDLLKITKPNVYFFYPNYTSIEWWGSSINQDEFFNERDSVLVYFRNSNIEEEKKLLNTLIAGVKNITNITLINTINETNERFYLISSYVKNWVLVSETNIKCTFDSLNLSTDQFLSNNFMFNFTGASMRSSEKYFSKKYSVKATSLKQYTAYVQINIEPGDSIIASVYTYSNDKKQGAIVISTKNSAIFYNSTETVSEKTKDGWSKLVLKSKIPFNLLEKQVGVYLYYPGDKACYFDEFNISIKKYN